MKASMLAGTVFASLALGALAAGWLVDLTPLPSRSTATSREAPAIDPVITSTVEAGAVAAVSPRPVLATLSVSSSIPAVAATISQRPATRKAPSAVHAVTPASAVPLLATKPHSLIIVAVKRRLAKAAALVLPPRSSRGAVAPIDHRYDSILTASEISRIKATLHLSSEQEAYWPRVAEMLAVVGRRQMAAGGAKVSLGSSGELMQFYFAAQPLIQSLRSDQKIEVRRLAHRMGFDSIGAYI